MIHVVLTCTSSKTLAIPPELQFSRIHGTTQDELFNQWIATTTSYGIKLPAIELYAGALKQFVIDCPDVKLWIASAGMGLISPSTPIPLYNITFNHRWADGVRRHFQPNVAERNWWDMLCTHHNTSITQLVKDNPDDTFIFSTSEAYYPALINDMCNASQYTPNAVFISRWLGGDFNGIRMPIDKRIISLIESTEYNMAPKYAQYCINRLQDGMSWHSIATEVQAYIDNIPKITRNKITRNKISDDGIITYINEYSNKTIPQITNMIRNDGSSCGSDRFNKIARSIGFIK